MVQPVKSNIRTREVLDWKGLHVFYFPLSSCSQKLRIFLNLKGVKWESHIINLFTNENLSERYLGINPRGLVPALVHDGQSTSRATISSSISRNGFRNQS